MAEIKAKGQAARFLDAGAPGAEPSTPEPVISSPASTATAPSPAELAELAARLDRVAAAQASNDRRLQALGSSPTAASLGPDPAPPAAVASPKAAKRAPTSPTDAPAEGDAQPIRPCSACKGGRYWRRPVVGGWLCGCCHPAPRAAAVEWVEVAQA